MSLSHDRKKHAECPARRHPCYLCTTHLPVNDSLVLWEAEHSGPGVSFLRFWGNTAYLNKTKAHLVKSIHSLPVLVKSCSNSYRISEFTAQDSHFLERGRQSQRSTRLSQCFSRCGPRAPTSEFHVSLLNIPSPDPGVRTFGEGREEWRSEQTSFFKDCIYF